MKWFTFLSGCGLTALVAISDSLLGTLGTTPVSSGEGGGVGSAGVGQVVSWNRGGEKENTWYSPEEWTYTKADKEWAEALSKLDYQAMTVAQFREKAANWQDETAFHQAEGAFWRLRNSLESEAPVNAFVDSVLADALDEAANLHEQAGCARRGPSHSGMAEYTRSANVYGDPYPVFVATAEYQVGYTAKDTLTVGMRSQLFEDYRKAVERFLEARGEAGLKDAKAVGKALEAELTRLDRELSTDLISLSSKLGSYMYEDMTN